MPFDNMLDIARLLGGTCSFTHKDVACVGDIQRIKYVPLGPGVVDFDLVDIRTVEGGDALMHEAHYTISFFLAEITDRPREMIVEQVIDSPPFGNIWSFRCKD